MAGFAVRTAAHHLLRVLVYGIRVYFHRFALACTQVVKAITAEDDENDWVAAMKAGCWSFGKQLISTGMLAIVPVGGRRPELLQVPGQGGRCIRQVIYISFKLLRDKFVRSSQWAAARLSPRPLRPRSWLRTCAAMHTCWKACFASYLTLVRLF